MSKAHRLSASKVDLAFWCAYSFRTDVPREERPSGEKAVRGTSVHLASDRWHKKLTPPELDAEGKGLWLSLLGWLIEAPRYNHSEIPLLYDAEHDTAAICKIGDGGERDYLGVTQMTIPARLDLLREREDDDEVWLVDIKTGSRSNTAPAPENMQLRTQALAAARHFGVNRVNVGLVFPMKTLVHKPKWHLVDADALDEHAGKLHRVLKMLPESQPVKGQHCWRCDLGPNRNFKATCPAWATEEKESA